MKDVDLAINNFQDLDSCSEKNLSSPSLRV